MKNQTVLFIGLLFLTASLVSAETDYSAIDEHAVHAPAYYAESLEHLSSYLTGPARNDVEKARAIYIWIVHNIVYDEAVLGGLLYDEESISPDRFDPAAIIRTKKAVCGGFSALFTSLCDHAGLETKVITGNIKNTNAFFGDEADYNTFGDGINHAWNVIKLNGTWRHVECTTGATWGNYHDPATGAVYYNPAVIDYYFLTPPEKMIQTHYPADPQWQMLDIPVGKQAFKESPFLFHGYFVHDVTLIEPQSYHVVCGKNPAIVLEDVPDNVYCMAVVYEGSVYDDAMQQKDYTVVHFVPDGGTKSVAQLHFNTKGTYIVLVTIVYHAGNDLRSDLTMMIRYEYR